MPKTAPSELAKMLGLDFKDSSILEEALTHRSFINENRDTNKSHNERLEFLGDAVLELIISEHLFTTYPKHPEGELTSFRAATVKTETLADVSRSIGIGKHLRMSRGEEATGGRDKDYLLANAFEAVLGAVYLDQGYESSKQFIIDHLVPRITHIVDNRLDIDPKTKFQEVAQSLFKQTPTYKLIKEEGPDHEKTFTMAVMIGSKEHGRGDGASKQKAEEQAANMALTKVQKIDKSSTIA